MHRLNLSIALLVLAAGCGPGGQAEAPLKAGAGQELVNINVPGMH